MSDTLWTAEEFEAAIWVALQVGKRQASQALLDDFRHARREDAAIKTEQ